MSRLFLFNGGSGRAERIVWKIQKPLPPGMVFGSNGCPVIPGKNIYSEIERSAKPETAWSVLVDNNKYPERNPYHVKVEGTLAAGNKLFVEIHKPNGDKVEIEPHAMRMPH